jgi:hypothetical protein
MTDITDVAFATGLGTTSFSQHIDETRPTLERRRRNPEDWPPRLRRREASTYLKEVHGLHVSPATLAKQACLGGGPVFEYFGRFPYYETKNLDRHAEVGLSGPRRSTSDPGEAALIERQQVTRPDERPASPMPRRRMRADEIARPARAARLQAGPLTNSPEQEG